MRNGWNTLKNCCVKKIYQVGSLCCVGSALAAPQRKHRVKAPQLQAGQRRQTSLRPGSATRPAPPKGRGMPTSLKELHLAPTDAQIAEMAEKALVGKTHIGSVKKLLPPDIIAIFAASR